ncbi:MAG: hypothetical protein AB7I96_10550 [Candidatus Dadabacteria bacterium]
MGDIKNRLSKRKIRRAIRDSGGSVTLIAMRCGVSRQTIYRWFRKYPELVDSVKEDQARLADIALGVKLKVFEKGFKDERIKQKVATEILDRWGKDLGWYKPGALPDAGDGGVRRVIIEYVEPEGGLPEVPCNLQNE